MDGESELRLDNPEVRMYLRIRSMDTGSQWQEPRSPAGWALNGREDGVSTMSLMCSGYPQYLRRRKIFPYFTF